METGNIFESLKNEILQKAKAAKACEEQYKRAYKSETVEVLLDVVKDNFHWACDNGVLAAELIEKYKDVFSANGIYCNESVASGYLLAYGNATVEASGNATVEAYGNATVRAYGNATVEAYGNATVEASGNATVEAYDNATVEAYDNVTVRAYDNAYVQSYSIKECKLSDNAIYRIIKENEIRYASGNLKFIKID